MEARDWLDVTYLASLVLTNGLAFLVIVLCYGLIYYSLGKETRHKEMKIAKRMALLVFTNFVCWAPIAFFASTALAGYPLIDVAKSKILLVFFYPLNLIDEAVKIIQSILLLSRGRRTPPVPFGERWGK